MDNEDKIIKHLEIIQGVVNRLAHDSFLIKGWSMTILAAAILFISKNLHDAQWMILLFLIPILGFWILDGYFLWQERLFRGLYDDTRQQKSTDFSMNILAQKRKPKCTQCRSIFSVTLTIFYLIEIVFVGFTFFILNYSKGI